MSANKIKTLNSPVFVVSAIVILGFVSFGFVLPQTSGEWFDAAQTWITRQLGWFYILSVTGFLIFALWLMVSEHGKTKLGKDDEDAEYANTSWFAMLFSAGMGIGLMFWGVAEPIYHFLSERGGDPASAAAARFAMRTTFFHWGLHAWAIYIVMGLSLAYFAYRHDLPLTIRSTLYPLLGRHIDGWLGHVVEILAVFGTIFGVATSLGLGVVQINAGLDYLGWLDVSPGAQMALIAGITVLATISVVSGLDVGIRRLSEMNLLLSVLLVLAVILVGPTIFLASAFVQSLGDYGSNLLAMTFTTDAYIDSNWQSGWTMFYWGWWISWSPFVGMFIARISRGRTIRSFVTGALIVPTLLTFVWMVVFGGTAMHMELNPQAYGGEQAMVSVAEQVTEDAPLGLFATLQNLPNHLPTEGWLRWLGSIPFAPMLIGLSVLVIATYFVTSSDSASLVVDMLTSGGNPNPPIWSRVFWALTEGAVAAALLYAGYSLLDEGGSAIEALKALQNAAIVTALPFCVVMVFICLSVIRGLRAEAEATRSALPFETVELGQELPDDQGPAVQGQWRDRLRAVLGRRDQPAQRQATSELAAARQRAQTFIQDTALPAFRDLAKELEAHGRTAAIERQPYQVTLVVRRQGTEEFRYGIRARVLRVAAMAFPELDDDSVPRRVVGEVILRGGVPRDYDADRFTRQGIVDDFIHEYAKWVGW